MDFQPFNGDVCGVFISKAMGFDGGDTKWPTLLCILNYWFDYLIFFSLVHQKNYCYSIKLFRIKYDSKSNHSAHAHTTMNKQIERRICYLKLGTYAYWFKIKPFFSVHLHINLNDDMTWTKNQILNWTDFEWGAISNFTSVHKNHTKWFTSLYTTQTAHQTHTHILIASE